ncbi:hypothetical protein D3C73_941920 [compost metagenome]
MPSPASTAADQASVAGAAIRPSRPSTSAPIAVTSAGRRSGKRPMAKDTSNPAAISATVTAPSNCPDAIGVQPSVV